MFDFWLEKENRKRNSTRTIFGTKDGAGFTLVELTVVLAIISILIVIVIVNTGEARKKGKDAAIQSALMEVRNAAELHYDTAKTYVGVCDLGDNTLANTGDFDRIEQYIIQQGGTVTCRHEDKAYAVISTLNLGNCWCVDSQGDSRKVPCNLPSAVCPL